MFCSVITVIRTQNILSLRRHYLRLLLHKCAACVPFLNNSLVLVIMFHLRKTTRLSENGWKHGAVFCHLAAAPSLYLPQVKRLLIAWFPVPRVWQLWEIILQHLTTLKSAFGLLYSICSQWQPACVLFTVSCFHLNYLQVLNVDLHYCHLRFYNHYKLSICLFIALSICQISHENSCKWKTVLHCYWLNILLYSISSLLG